MYDLVENKICSFNVNEYHLVTILMPYIYESIKETKKIVTFFEKDLRAIYEKILNTNMMFWKKRKKFDEIDWNRLEINEISKKFEDLKENDIIIVAGKDEFIERINKLILNFHTNFTLVNCFEICSNIKKMDYICSMCRITIFSWYTRYVSWWC